MHFPLVYLEFIRKPIWKIAFNIKRVEQELISLVLTNIDATAVVGRTKDGCHVLQCLFGILTSYARTRAKKAFLKIIITNIVGLSIIPRFAAP